MRNLIGIFVVVIVVVIRLLIMAAKSNASKPKNYPPPPPQNPFQNPSQPNYQNTFTSPANFNPAGNNPPPQQPAYYCMYCGKKFQTAKALLMDTCFKHPNSEAGLQKHVLYRGPGKPNIGF